MSSLVAFLGDNSIQIDLEEGLQIIEKNFPDILFPNEKILFAFRNRGGWGRDSSFLTSLRFLVADKRGLIGKRVKYISVPYQSIKAFSVETAGSMDSDVELTLYCSGGIGKISMDFMTGVDIFAINMLLSKVVLGEKNLHGSVMPTTTNTSGGGFMERIGFFDNNVQIDATQVQEEFKHVFVDNEIVELAFKCGRDSFILTTKRLLKVDVQGLSGKKIKFLSVKWSSVRAFSIETAGSFDRDCDMTIFTSISTLTRIEMDLKKGGDVYAVQTYFSDKLLGMDQDYNTQNYVPDGSASGAKGSMVTNLFSWLGDDNSTIDAAEMDRRYHTNPRILQNNEFVEMAFKGRRDIVLFTNKRLIIIDLKGWSGKKVEYKTVPWTTVQAFGVRSAGSFMDKDAEAFVWTDLNDVFFPPRQQADDPPEPPIPRMSFLEFDFHKDRADMMAIQKYLSERCLRGKSALSPTDALPSSGLASDPGMLESFMNWLGDDSHEIDPTSLDQKLENALAHGEHVIMAFKSGRDTTVFTSKRVLSIDVKGMTGKKVEWLSIPFSSVRGYAVESAGSFDRDSELKLYCKTYWDHDNSYTGSKYKFDFRKGRADIIAIENLISWNVIGLTDGSVTNDANYVQIPNSSSIDSFFSWVADDGVAIDPVKVNENLHSSPAILQQDETAEHVYKIGRDMIIFTTKRILFIDRQGWSGKKVEYMTYPLKYCTGYNVKSQGAVGSFKPAEANIYTDIPGSHTFSQEIRKGDKEIWNIQHMLGKKIMKL